MSAPEQQSPNGGMAAIARRFSQAATQNFNAAVSASSPEEYYDYVKQFGYETAVYETPITAGTGGVGTFLRTAARRDVVFSASSSSVVRRLGSASTSSCAPT